MMARCCSHRLAVAILIATTTVASFAQPNSDGATESITLFVGPQIRDGFIDIDQKIRDSMNDIRRAIGSTQKFHLVFNKDEALLGLEVLGRGSSGVSGVVGVPSLGGTTLSLPIEDQYVTALLKVGSYERLFIGEGDNWSDSADDIVKDLLIWLEVNGGRLRDYVQAR